MPNVLAHFGNHCDSVDSQTLLALLRQGSSAGYDILSAKYGLRLFRIALRIVRNECDAEDVVQDTLISAFTKIAGFRGDAGVYTWLVRIATNKSLMVLRTRGRHQMISLDHGESSGASWAETLAHPAQNAERAAISQQQVENLRAAVERLPRGYKPVIERWLSGQVSVRELSAEFGLTEPAVKSRLLRGRLMLAQTVQGRNAERVTSHRAKY
jgi:RNA polymerase sigma-70 factor (ECF subfamily)